MLQKYARPEFDKIAEKFNQKILYTVPWPTQYLHAKVKADKLDGLKGLKIRVPDRQAGDMVNALGMVAVQIPWGETVPALASGAVVGVTTSSVSGVDGKFWEFLKYFYRTNHVWSSQIVTINNDTWKKISAAHQKAITDLAAKLEPEFWAVANEADADEREAPGRRRHGDDRSAAADAERDAREDRGISNRLSSGAPVPSPATSSRSTRRISVVPERQLARHPSRRRTGRARSRSGAFSTASTACPSGAAWASVLCILGILALIVGEVAARNILNVSFSFAWEFSSFLMGAAFMLGAAYSLRSGAQIRVMAVLDNLPPARAPCARHVATSVRAIAVAYLACALAQLAWLSFMRGSRSEKSSELPLWIAQAPLALGAALLTLADAGAFARLLRGEPGEDVRLRVGQDAEGAAS